MHAIFVLLLVANAARVRNISVVNVTLENRSWQQSLWYEWPHSDWLNWEWRLRMFLLRCEVENVLFSHYIVKLGCTECDVGRWSASCNAICKQVCLSKRVDIWHVQNKNHYTDTRRPNEGTTARWPDEGTTARRGHEGPWHTSKASLHPLLPDFSNMKKGEAEKIWALDVLRKSGSGKLARGKINTKVNNLIISKAGN